MDEPQGDRHPGLGCAHDAFGPRGQVSFGCVFVAVFADEEFVVEDEAVLVFLEKEFGFAELAGFFSDGSFLHAKNPHSKN